MDENIKIGDKVLIDGDKTGEVYNITHSVYQVIIDGYICEENEPYPYHNINKKRCKIIK